VLRVLITGSPFVRASRWLTTSGGKSPTEAAETIADSDKARALYLKRFYDVDHESPEDYDITLSTDALPAATITELIIQAARVVP
jgi:cytidylate kinase